MMHLNFFMWCCIFLYALQSSSYSCGAGGVGCCLHTDQSPAVGSQKCWYLQQPPSGKSNALHSTFLCIKGCICTGSVVTFTKFAVLSVVEAMPGFLFLMFQFYLHFFISWWKIDTDMKSDQGLLPSQPQHVKHIPLPHPSDNSNMEKNERGSALVSSLPCTVITYSYCHGGLWLCKWNSPFLVSPPVLATIQSHAYAGKDCVWFPVFSFIVYNGFLVLGFPVGRDFSAFACRIYHVVKLSGESQDD